MRINKQFGEHSIYSNTIKRIELFKTSVPLKKNTHQKLHPLETPLPTTTTTKLLHAPRRFTSHIKHSRVTSHFEPATNPAEAPILLTSWSAPTKWPSGEIKYEWARTQPAFCTSIYSAVFPTAACCSLSCDKFISTSECTTRQISQFGDPTTTLLVYHFFLFGED